MSDTASDTVEAFPDVEEGPEGQPVVALFFVTALIVVAAIFLPVPPIEGSFARIVAIGAGTVIAAVLWGIAYLVTLRHSSLAWKLGSLALMWLVAVVVADRSISQATLSMYRDVGAFEMIKLDPNGRPALPEKSDKVGPISKMFVDFFKANSDDLNKTEGEIGKLNLEILNDAWRTNDNPSVLQNCERADKGKPVVRGYAKRQQERVAEFKARAQAMWLPEKQKADLLKTIDRHGGANRLGELVEIQVKMFDEWRIRCTLLAKRKWQAGGRMFLFTSTAELAEMRTAAERHYKLRQDYYALFRKATDEVGALNMGIRMPMP